MLLYIVTYCRVKNSTYPVLDFEPHHPHHLSILKMHLYSHITTSMLLLCALSSALPENSVKEKLPKSLPCPRNQEEKDQLIAAGRTHPYSPRHQNPLHVLTGPLYSRKGIHWDAIWEANCGKKTKVVTHPSRSKRAVDESFPAPAAPTSTPRLDLFQAPPNPDNIPCPKVVFEEPTCGGDHCWPVGTCRGFQLIKTWFYYCDCYEYHDT